MIYTGFVNSMQGLVKVEATEEGITAISFVNAAEAEKVAGERQISEGESNKGESNTGRHHLLSDKVHTHTNAITDAACRQLQAYFDGNLREFDLPLSPKGTAFQNQVWHALKQVKYGETASYLDIAKAIGNPKAVRAVGMANGRNPIAIVVPCHRIIGSNKTLTGYAGGLSRKQYLLNLEGAQGVLWL
ncbi:hypothetical protein KUL118_15760 [Tenacibaculum sp. KUL118]|nr:hypothetical protein KUL118_15760 [Tenacibaculum sp. KUL118]